MPASRIQHFVGLQPRRAAGRLWAVVLVSAVLIAEIVFVSDLISRRGLFEYVALDYRGSRAAGKAILDRGLAAAYDADRLEAHERRIYDRWVLHDEGVTLPFGVVPAPYPPPFSLLFVPSTLVPPIAGFVAWTLLHAAVLVLYQLRLAKVFGVGRPGLLILAVAVSLPAFIHLVMGQISLWLMVFFGEAVIALDRGRPVRSGAWMALMVFKVQSLVLLVPACLVGRRWKVLLGMALTLTLLFGSTLLIDPRWPAAYARQVLPFFGAAGQEMNAFPSSMVNWRAFALNASRLLPAALVWPVAGIGLVATALAGLLCGRWVTGHDRLATGLAWLGLAAATCAASWHAHVHQALILVPPLYMILGVVPALRAPVEAALAGTSALFLVAVALSSEGFAHDLVGTVVLAMLLAVTATCLVAERSLSRARLEAVG